MKITDRDKKIAAVFALVALLAAYWFLLLSPKRSEADKAEADLAKQKSELVAAQTQVQQLQGQQASFQSDFTEIVKLGKAIPSKTDMPSLLVQLQFAAKGTGIQFQSISTADSAAPGGGASSTTAPQAPAAPGGAAAAGGDKASTSLGRATENAGNTTNSTNDKSAKDAAQGAGADQQTSQSSKPGGVPVGGGAGAAGQGAAKGGGSQPAPGLTNVPLTMKFRGSFFHLADFFHRVKRFVYVANRRIRVQGRLVTIDSLKFSAQDFPRVSVEVGATAYLSPKDQGVTAGASPTGPAPQKSQPASSGSGSGGTKPPTTPPPTAAGAP